MLILFIFICDLRQKVAQAQLTRSQALDGMRKMHVVRRPTVGKILWLNLRQLVKPLVAQVSLQLQETTMSSEYMCRQFCSCNLSQAPGSAETDFCLKTKTAITKTKQRQNSTTIQFCMEMSFLTSCVTIDKYVIQRCLGMDALFSFQKHSTASPSHE